MAAAYNEHRLGRDAYLREIGRRDARDTKRCATRATIGRSYSRTGTAQPPMIGRWIYQKGAVVLHELRETLG